MSSDFLEHYDGVIDIKNKQLITIFNTVPLFKIKENYEKNVNTNFDNQNLQNIPKPISVYQNKHTLKARCEKITKL